METLSMGLFDNFLKKLIREQNEIIGEKIRLLLMKM